MVANCSSTDLTQQLNRIEKKIDSLDLSIKEFNFRLTQDLDGLNRLLKKVDWIKIAALITTIAGSVAAILAIIKIWSQGAYLSKILSASEQAAKDSSYTAKEVQGWAKGAYFSKILATSEQAAKDANYTAKEIQGWAKGAYFSKILKSQGEIQNFLNKFGNSTVQNFRVIQQEIQRIVTQSPQGIDERFNELKRQIELMPQKIGNLPAIKDIPSRIKEVTREVVREIAKLPDQVGGTVTRTVYDVYEPLRQRIQDIPRQIEKATREVILQRDTTKYSDPKLDQILSGLTPLGLIPANLAGLDNKINKLNNDLNRQISGLPGAVATANCNSGCSRAGAAQRAGLQAGQDALNAKMDALNAAMNTAQLGLLRKIDGTTTKTLDQLGNPLKGGISGKLSRIGDVLSQSPVISWINLLVTLHNAGQLSASLVQTLGDTLSLGLNTFVFKDSEGQGIDVNKVISDSVSGWIIKIIGIKNYTTFKRELALWNNVYRSAANIVNTVRSIGDSTNAIASIAAENSGKIGNALLKDRVIAEGSFNWMSENVTPSSAVLDRLNNLDDAANALSIVLSETANVLNAKKELDEQTKKFESDLEALDPRTRPDNKPVKESQERDKMQSQSELIDENTITGVGSGQ